MLFCYPSSVGHNWDIRSVSQRVLLDYMPVLVICLKLSSNLGCHDSDGNTGCVKSDRDQTLIKLQSRRRSECE